MTPASISFARAQLVVPSLGLGCSRLGSTLGIGGAAAADLLRHALDHGVRLFDTADIYGQGESERLIGAAIAGRRDSVTIITKAGQRFTAAQRLAARVKAPLRHLAAHLPGLRGAIAQRRAAPLPRDYTPGHLHHAVEAGLRRLRLDRIDLFLLHSPSLAQLGQAAAGMEMLERLQDQGKLRGWGVSCDDAETALAAMALPGVAALQLPLVLAPALRSALPRAQRAGIGIIWREVFAGTRDAAGREAALAGALLGGRSVALVGTTSPAHLDQALAMLPREAVAA